MEKNIQKLHSLIKLAQGSRSQNQFAMHCGLSSAALTKILNGERFPSPDTLMKIADKAHNDVSYEALMESAGYINTEGKVDTKKAPANAEDKELDEAAEILNRLSEDERAKAAQVLRTIFPESEDNS